MCLFPSIIIIFLPHSCILTYPKDLQFSVIIDLKTISIKIRQLDQKVSHAFTAGTVKLLSNKKYAFHEWKTGLKIPGILGCTVILITYQNTVLLQSERFYYLLLCLFSLQSSPAGAKCSKPKSRHPSYHPLAAGRGRKGQSGCCFSSCGCQSCDEQDRQKEVDTYNCCVNLCSWFHMKFSV